MKKVLTILALMMILVSAVFAADKADAAGTAAIKVNVTIGDEFPRFQLATKSGATSAKDNVAATPETATSTLSAENKALLTKASKTAEVVFSINQIADARCYDAYHLTVTATDLYLLKSTDAKINRTFAQAQTAATDNEKFTVVSSIAHAKTTDDAEKVKDIIDYTGTDETIIKIDYQGILVAATEESAVEIGTATVLWNSNVNAKSGDYQALVTLTVESK